MQIKYYGLFYHDFGSSASFKNKWYVKETYNIKKDECDQNICTLESYKYSCSPDGENFEDEHKKVTCTSCVRLKLDDYLNQDLAHNGYEKEVHVVHNLLFRRQNQAYNTFITQKYMICLNEPKWIDYKDATLFEICENLCFQISFPHYINLIRSAIYEFRLEAIRAQNSKSNVIFYYRLPPVLS